MTGRQFLHDEEKAVMLLKTSKEAVNEAGLPPAIPAGGLSPERQAYLYKEIRQFVAPAFQDELCSPPPDAVE